MTAEEKLKFASSPQGREAAQDYLSQAKWLDAALALKLSQMDMLRQRARRAAALTAEPRPGEDVAAALTALERDIQADYHRLTLLQREIRECLSRVPQPLPRLVLEMHYLQGSPFFRIAMALHYDERQIYRYQAQGLEQVALQLAEKE